MKIVACNGHSKAFHRLVTLIFSPNWILWNVEICCDGNIGNIWIFCSQDLACKAGLWIHRKDILYAITNDLDIEKMKNEIKIYLYEILHNEGHGDEQ